MSSSSFPSVVTSVEAYVKTLLHCQKYPTQTVSGFLIGKRITDSSNNTSTTNNNSNSVSNNNNNNINNNNNNNNNNSSNNISTNNINSSSNDAAAPATDSVFVVDAVPLFHTIAMTNPHPMFDVAYAQVSSYARTKGLVLLGYYIANELPGDSRLSPLTEKILRTLQEKVSVGHYPLLWTIVGSHPTAGVDVRVSYYAKGSEHAPASMLTFGRWNSDTLSCEATESSTAALEVFGNAMDAFKQFQLIDFEDHLENVQLNYLEQAVPV
ncbi:uncharacterized protein TM35_000271040 [Trypanosoma theileri]|uniref:MPN domain-containing protein n=1 Tax=Trypanosoma theileri TaxID=67003 RepID=A0A1X0NP88_9TRYP|nr:uncharacterized protein TM35_000271040 [Trypanosoma theileri]ORC86514.1 hypothetical protein TM35_000271040 [Trypanosoma theileri]